MTKKLLFLAVAAFCTLAFTSCGGKSTNNSPTANTEAADTAVAKTADWLSGNWEWSNGDLTERESFRLELQVADGKITGRYILENVIVDLKYPLEGTVSANTATIIYYSFCDDEYTGTGKAEIKKLNDNEIEWNKIQTADCGNHVIPHSDVSGDYTPDKLVLKKVIGDGNSADKTGSETETQNRVIINGVDFEMVYVAGGTFTMGCTSEQGGDCEKDEKPAHQVTLSDFYIGKYEVTQAQWKAVMGNNPSYFEGDNLPVEWVSWDYIQEFIRKLNQQTGNNYRLPTEAEWEFAARGGNQSRGYKYSGSNTADNVAWYGDNSGSKTHPVGTKQANELGIYDMSGNVWECCSDWYGSYSSGRGASTGSYRVCRGGGCDFYAGCARVSYRSLCSPDDRNKYTGFRLASSSKQVQRQEKEEAQAQREREAEQQRQSNSIPMVYVAGGTFTMGCTSERGGVDCENGEKSTHQVTLSDYYIGKYEVTQAQWKAVMGNNPSNFKGDNLPVERVSWDDIVGTSGSTQVINDITYYSNGFIYKLNQMTGKKYRLPTEAEWEFAARGGNQSRGYKYSGSNIADNVAWYDDNSGDKTHPVGTKQANELGIYDMSGNVREWCSDWYSSSYYDSSPSSNPQGPSTGLYRVHRGGNWYYSEWYVCVSRRNHTSPYGNSSLIGFRLASSSK
jgi:formylglycine-generating enzyme required for sulfatase activity